MLGPRTHSKTRKCQPRVTVRVLEPEFRNDSGHPRCTTRAWVCCGISIAVKSPESRSRLITKCFPNTTTCGLLTSVRNSRSRKLRDSVSCRSGVSRRASNGFGEQSNILSPSTASTEYADSTCNEHPPAHQEARATDMQGN